MDQELQLTEQEQIRRNKMEDLRQKGIDPFGSRYERTENSKTLKEKYAAYSKEELHELNKTAKVAGRIMTKRCKGKVGFMHIQDKFGQLQVYLRFDTLGEEEYALFKVADIGDIVNQFLLVFENIFTSDVFSFDLHKFKSPLNGINSEKILIFSHIFEKKC